MALVLFLRAVNVGGHQAFRPSALAKDLDHLGIVNVGAAGTFVIPGAITPSKLRAAVQEQLPFRAEMMICAGRDVLSLVSRDPFPAVRSSEEIVRYVTVMDGAPRVRPKLPLGFPAGAEWETRVVALAGPFALSLRRRTGRPGVDPNAAIEKALGVRATTRNWNTFVKLSRILER